MTTRKHIGGAAAFGLALLPIWLTSLLLNVGAAKIMVSGAANLVLRGTDGAWAFVLRTAAFLLMPYGTLAELGYYSDTFILPGLAQEFPPSPLFWVWVLVAPVLLLVMVRWWSGRRTRLRLSEAYRQLLIPAAAFALMVWLGTVLSFGADGLLVLIGPFSRTPGDAQLLYAWALRRTELVLPYLVVWVCLVAPVLASLVPLGRDVPQPVEQALPAGGGKL